MTNEITKVFSNEKFGSVRVVMVESKPWFVAKDICNVLEIKNTTDSLKRLDADEVTRFNLGGLAGETNAVNEYGLYSLILGSRKPEAREFKRWITHEVLPSIRKTGSYNTIPQTYVEALRLAADQAEQIEQQNLQLLEAKPKVEFFDAVADSKDAIEIASVAKVLGIKGMGRNNLFELLRNKKILMNNNCPYQKYVDGGYFRVLEQKFCKPNGDICINIKTLVYQKGVDYIRKVVQEEN